MPEALRSISNSTPEGRDRVQPDARPVPQRDEQIARLQELAAAANIQERSQKQLKEAGFSQSRYFTENEGWIGREDIHDAGKIRYRTSFEMRREMIGAMDGPEISPALQNLKNDYLVARSDAIRFACGRVRYLLNEPWTPPRLAKAMAELQLPDTATQEQLERKLHFDFQRLYRKPPDDWSAEEAKYWDVLVSYIDLESYNKENFPTDNRIGRLIKINSDSLVILWSTKGEQEYDSRWVPPELLIAHSGDTVHAELQVGPAGESWLSIHVAPPFPSNIQVVEEDLSAAKASPPPKLPLAHWPKIKA